MPKKFHAEVWTESIDENGRMCWQNGTTVTYEPPGKGAMFNSMRFCPTQFCAPQAVVPFAPQAVVPGAPVQPAQQFPRTIVIVKDEVKPNKWKKYCDEKTGEYYYHNAGLKKTTWDPKEYDEQENADKPPPPKEDPPQKKKPKKRGKYDPPCRCGCGG